MGLEAGTYINSLNASNPVGASDPKSQGDDHLRLIKSTIKNTFPNITGAVTLTHAEINDAALKTNIGFSQKGIPRIFTSSGAYTMTAGTKAIIVEVQGGGGSGAASSNSGGAASCGGGGGAGGYSMRFIEPAANGTIVVGAGGSAPSAGANNGNPGGTSSFTDGTNTLTCNGGDGGVHLSSTSAAVLASAVALGGAASGGNVNIRGDYGGSGIVAGGATAYGGGGASSKFGVGGNAQLASGTANSSTGTSGSGFGSGSGGARNGSAGAGLAGVAGQAGVVVITELF